MLKAILRESISKSATKALRNDGYLIANIYGKGVSNIHCAVKYNEFLKFIKAKSTLNFTIDVAGTPYDVVVQEYQKDPVTNRILHVDLMLVQPGVITHFKIPVKTHGIPKGLKNKGVLLYSKRRIKVKARKEDIPHCYDLDVTPLDVGSNILVRDLPKIDGVKVIEKPDIPVVGVIKAK